MRALDLAIQALTSRTARPCFRALMRGRATVFMLHRLDDRAAGITGHSIEFVHRAVHALRKSGARFVSLRTLIDSFQGGKHPGDDLVAFTIDDGFADQAVLASAGFVELGCPVTIFLITGFLDGALWPWENQLKYVFLRSPLDVLEMRIAGKHFNLPLGSGEQRLQAMRAVRAWCKTIPNEGLYGLVASIGTHANVQIPVAPPSAERAMSWDDARALELLGVDFGPHSVTHRIFSRLDTEDDAREEIEMSWARLRQELRRPLPVFAWPTGTQADYTARDMELARNAGLNAAFATDDDYSYTHSAVNGGTDLYALRRFSLPAHIRGVLECGSWIERGKQIVRRSV